MAESEESCCLPGDITITQVHTGWMLGRALKQNGPGPWWEFIAIFPDLGSAVSEARDLARQRGVGTWFHEGGMKYHPIAPDDSPFVPPD